MQGTWNGASAVIEGAEYTGAGRILAQAGLSEPERDRMPLCVRVVPCVDGQDKSRWQPGRNAGGERTWIDVYVSVM